MQIGTNLDSVRDYASHMAFSDCFRMARAFGTPAVPYDGKATLGADGLPIGEFGIVIHTGVSPVGGIYKLSFKGKADVALSASNGSIQNMFYSSVFNTSTADIILNENSQLFLTFKNTNGALKDLSLIRPGCTSAQLFNPKFIESLKPYKVIRFMDWLHTNDSPIKTWADRKLPTELMQSGERGVCLEYCIELCNQTGADAWFNIPHQADDGYVTLMAELIKQKLKPELKVYVEYSNEVWNSIFSQTKWNQDQAILEVASGDKTLNLDGADTNQVYWGWRRVAKRLVRIGEIFKSSFGESGDRLRPILASQVANSTIGRKQLEYIAKYFTRVSDRIYGVAGAPYFATQADDALGATLQTIASGLKDSVTGNVARMTQDGWDGKTINANLNTPTLPQLAKFYGVKFTFYECGQHMIPAKGNLLAEDLDMKIQSTEEMGEAYASYFQGMQDQNVDLAMHFVHMGLWNKYGYWGLFQTYGTETPKLKAMLMACQKFNPSPLDPLEAQIEALKAQIADLSDKLKKSVSDLAASDLLNQNLKTQISALTLVKQILQSKIDRASVSVDQAKLDLS